MSLLPYAVYALCAGGAGYWNGIAQPGEPGYTPAPTHHFRGLFENDVVSGQDCNYTHGTRFDYAHVMRNGDAWGLSLTQNIYTPETHSKSRVRQQHPYCGYLAVGGAYLLRGRHFGMSSELQFGTTGSPSLSGQMQNGLHEIFKMDTWDGWHDQIPPEVTFQLTSRQDLRVAWLERSPIPGLESDGIFFVRESVGTFNISSGAGLTFRIGRNLPPSAQLTGNSAAVFGIGAIEKPDYRRDAPSYFLAMEGMVNYVARDLTVDGGAFRHYTRTCSRTPWQPEGRVGACVVYHGIEYYAGVMMRGRTYKTQSKDSVLGTFSITWHW